MRNTALATLVETTIRDASAGDIPAIVEMGRKFLLDGPYKEHLADSPEQATNLTTNLLRDNKATILISEEGGELTGVFAFAVFPYPYSGEMVAGELIWYVKPDKRKGAVGLRLLWEAEKRARLAGAKRMHLTMPAETEHMRPLFERQGYRAVEIAYQGNL